MNNLKTKVNDLDVGKLKTAPVDLKKLSDVVDNNVDVTTLFHINQDNTDQQHLEKKNEVVDKKNTIYEWFSDYNCFE